MKIVETSYCTGSSVEFDGIDEENLTGVKRGEILLYLIEKIKENAANNDISLMELVNLFDNYEEEYEEGSCDTCGHSMSWKTWEI